MLPSTTTRKTAAALPLLRGRMITWMKPSSIRARSDSGISIATSVGKEGKRQAGGWPVASGVAVQARQLDVHPVPVEDHHHEGGEGDPGGGDTALLRGQGDAQGD